MNTPESTHPTIAIIGGGFSGAVLALKLAGRAGVGAVLLFERNRRVGVGLAYGACAAHHLLNVPVERLEIGLAPRFADWLAAQPDFTPTPGTPLAESFAPRALYGRYLEQRIAAAPGVGHVRGEAVRIEERPRRVVLRDGRSYAADVVVLATGNAAPAPLPGGEAMNGARTTPDPWAYDAFDAIADDDRVLMIGAGLTMVDVALSLRVRGHRGPLIAVSRRGLTPARHVTGGAWAPFLGEAVGKSARAALGVFRRALADAARAGVPWQRVMDAARPDAARVWRAWPMAERRRFLRHLRARWDAHRHRMPPTVAVAINAMAADGQLSIRAGRIVGADPRGDAVEVRLAITGAAQPVRLPVDRIINCTGPRTDLMGDETPLVADLRRQGLVRVDVLGLHSEDGALIDASGAPSRWLFALGPLTRPALWEVTAVPEINVQADALAKRLADPARTATRAGDAGLSQAFADLGAGI